MTMPILERYSTSNRRALQKHVELLDKLPAQQPEGDDEADMNQPNLRIRQRLLARIPTMPSRSRRKALMVTMRASRHSDREGSPTARTARRRAGVHKTR